MEDIRREKVVKFEARYRKHFETDKTWQESMEIDIHNQSEGKIRAFHIFFESPQECFSGIFKAQALTKQDVINMYPKMYEAIQKVPKGKFFYIFHCNGGVAPGQALSVNTVL